ncbi:MAG: histidine--tRNA ligase [Candidatus Hydrothermarchaeales archaeon]
MFSRPRGTRDVLVEEMEARRRAEATLRETFERFGYREVQTPTFEHLELITAKSGEEIKKHLYSFEDKSERKLALRPELSAPTIRLYVNELRTRPKPRKLYYFENCFRYERPQKGRYREFWQAGVELIGSSRPEAEAEVIALAVACLENLGLSNFKLSIGHLGIIRAVLAGYGIAEDLQNHIIDLLDKKDIKGIDRLSLPEEPKKNLLEIVRLKGERSEAFKKAEEMLTGRAQEELERFGHLLYFFEGFGVTAYEVDLGVVRGLDYYNGTVFEIYAEGLGAQDQICGGGTYSLVKLFGGDDVPSCGFAFGFDRLMLALEGQKGTSKGADIPKVFVVPTSKKVLNRAIEITTVLRKDISCDLELMGRKLDKSLSYADAEGIPYVLIVSDEVKSDNVILKDMHTGKQRIVKVEEVPDEVE